MTNTPLYELSQKLGHLLQQKQLRLVTAESCTGGYIAQMITAVADSSQWFERGFVTYSNEAKMEMLGVAATTLEKDGAVSEATVTAMAQGALLHSYGDISISVSGIAGPSGGSIDKPIGTVWFAIVLNKAFHKTYLKQFSGDREAIRYAAVEFALMELYSVVMHEG